MSVLAEVSLPELFEDLAAHHEPAVSLAAIVSFLRLATHLKPEILLNRRHSSSEQARLPEYLVVFLSSALSMSLRTIECMWRCLQSQILAAEGPELSPEEAHMVLRYGDTPTLMTNERLAPLMLYPPTYDCLRCERPLTHLVRQKVVVFTENRGPVAGYKSHLTCQDCHLQYHPDYFLHTEQQIRQYYGGIPDYILIDLHFYFSAGLCRDLTSQMSMSATAASNCAKIYNESSNATRAVLPTDWQFSFTMSGPQVLNAFFLHAILADLSERPTPAILRLNDNGTQADRLKDAIEERNAWMRVNKQPCWDHACSICCKFLEGGEGHAQLNYLRAVVVDGVTLGHPCCSHVDPKPCTIPLEKSNHLFCPAHSSQAKICAAANCKEENSDGFRTCSRPEHRQREEHYRLKGKAFFALRRQAQDRSKQDEVDSAAMGDADNEPVQGPGNGRKTKYGRTWSHNEQLIVTPCGIIVARITMYHAEATSAVVEFIMETYGDSVPPQIIFFDSNCVLSKYVRGAKSKEAIRAWFKRIGLPVDVFHFKAKHKKTDDWCQSYCNPALFPELLNPDNTWVFNSSAAEQVNAWIGDYQSIVREMLTHNYEFFLDEMIKQRNRRVVRELREGGHGPYTLPEETLYPLD